VLDQLQRQRPDPLAAEGQVDNGVRPATDVDDGRGERLVHRHAGLPESMDPGAIAECLAEGDPEDERDVLDRVVLVDLEVAVRRDRQVEEAVMTERREEVVVEPESGRDRRVARAVEPERDGDVGLAGRARDRDSAALAGADRVVPDRGRHASASSRSSPAASIKRSFSAGARTVSRR
jgi:hypothetical protein